MSTDRYLVTARKYRPRRFDEVVAQKHVTETLKNAIRQDRLAHAYLFSGPRGVGKTTAARVLAKAINCTTPLEQRADSSEPCLECDSCKSFAEGRSLNVIEIDAASNRGVDDARELRDTVRIPPQGARKKVYIVDEVHMLTPAAFNTLLKTLEEPPGHALFILATTEPHKVLPTIVSRCQRFDFRRIAVAEIVERLREICDNEEVATDEASLLLIARKGEGALRDALSVFDQAVSLCGTSLEYGRLADALGIVDVDLFFEVSDCVDKADAARIMKLVQRVVAEGYDFREFLAGLSMHLRNLLVAVTLPETDLIEDTEQVRARYRSSAGGFTRSDLLRLLMVVSDTEAALRGSAHPRLQFEIGLLKMASMVPGLDLREAIAKIDDMARSAREQGLTETGLAAAAATRSKPRGSPEAVSPDASASIPEQPDATERTEDRQASESDDKDTEPASVESDPTSKASDATPAETGDESGSPHRAEPAAQTDPPSKATGDEAATEDGKRTNDPDRPIPERSGSSPSLFGPPAISVSTGDASTGSGSRATSEGSAALSTAAPAERTEETASTLRKIETEWLAFVRGIKEERIHVGSLLQHCAPADFRRSALLIDVPDDFHRRLLDNQADFLSRHLRASLDVPVESFEFIVKTGVASTSDPNVSDIDPHDYMQQKRQENPVVRAIFEEFGGELVW